MLMLGNDGGRSSALCVFVALCEIGSKAVPHKATTPQSHKGAKKAPRAIRSRYPAAVFKPSI